MRLLLLLLAFVAWTALAKDAAAQTAETSSAALKAEGDALMQNIRYEEALEKYERAYELSPNPALLYNMGRALEALGRYPAALEKLRSFDAKAPPEIHAKVPNLQKLIDDVEGRTTLLAVVAPGGATVRMGDVVLGTAPLAEVRVNAGKRVRMEATLEGFDPDVQEVDLPGKGKVTVTFALVPKDKSGILAIDSPVKGATVYVDGGAGRQVPTEIRVTAGKHTVRLTAEGYRENVIDVEVAVGERKPIIIEPGAAPAYEQWWFWTLIGTVAAGGAAAGITGALLTEGPPDEGTIPPGQVKISGAQRSATWQPRHAPPSRAFTFGPVPVWTVRF